MDEQVDILEAPLFKPTGQVKTREQAYRDGDWIGTFNLWVVNRDPEPAIVYQLRGPNVKWAPNLLDVTAGGHLQAGEKLIDGLREVEEELGKQYAPDQLVALGRKLYVGFNPDGTSHNNIIDIYMVEDNEGLSTYALQAEEVYALCVCPIRELLKVHRDSGHTFSVKARTAGGETIELSVRKKSFPENWDDYHHKIAVLADRYFKGEKDLIY